MFAKRSIFKVFIAVVFIVAAVIVTHLPSIEGDFHFDDDHSIVENPYLQSIENIPKFFTDPSMFSRNEGSTMYRPLLLSTYVLNFLWGGFSADKFLFINLFVHTCVCILAFLFHKSMGIRFEISLVASMLFAVHPLVVEPINYISARSTSLALLFALISVILYLRAGTISAVASFISYGLALCTKSSVILLPLLMMLIDMRKNQNFVYVRWRRLLGHLILSGFYFFVTHVIIYNAVLNSPARSLFEQICTQSKAIIYYLHLLIGLQPQSVDHAFNTGSPSDWSVIFSSLAILSIVLISIRLFLSKTKVYPAYFSWVVLWLLPTIVVPLNMLVNERRLYAPLLALCLGFSVMLWRLSEKKRLFFSIILLFIFIGFSTKRTEIWKTEQTLWEDARIKAPNLVRPYLRLGMFARKEGDLDDAQRYYRDALTIDPYNAAAFNNIASVYRMEGRFEDAEDALRSSLLIRPDYTEALINLGSLLSLNGNYVDGEKYLLRAEELAPKRFQIKNNLGTHYLRIGKYKEAEIALRNALRINRGSAPIFYNLGGALEGQGNLKDAIIAYQTSLDIDSMYVASYAKLGQVFEKLNKLEIAFVNYRKFLSIWKGNEKARSDVKKRLDALIREPN